MDKDFLSSQEIAKLVVLIKESYRSTSTGVKYFIEPAAGTLIQATSKTHSIIFGRRGSGKSSLLRKAASDLTVDRRPIAYVDLETFKEHSYPDVLLSVLIQTFKEFAIWLRTAAINPSTKTSFWKELFGRIPERPAFNKKRVDELANKLEEMINELKGVLNSSDQTDVKRIQKNENRFSNETDINSNLTTPIAQIKSKIGEQDEYATFDEIQEIFQQNKVDYLRRNILEYQDAFKEMSAISGGDSYLFLDDLYYIRRSDQAKLIDYFHRIAKGNNLWVKLGTVRHRTTWYIHDDPPYGLKLGDDAHEINLDLTLENYPITKSFLVKIIQSFIDESGVQDINKILAEGTIDRLVLASGGVARDFLGIFDRSIAVAQERKERGEHFRGGKAGKEDVNVAAGKYSSTKMDEFRTDTQDEGHKELENAFKRIQFFCLYKANSNLFLYDITGEKGLTFLQELMDLRLIHKVNSHVTVSKRVGKLFEAYMLDVSTYVERRRKRGFEELMFWEKDTNIRLLGLILEENFLLSNEPLIEEEEEVSPLKTNEKDKDAKEPDQKDKQLPLKGFE